LVPYAGTLDGILPALVGGDMAALRMDIREATRLVDA
jgi:hypothetical protein